MRVVASDFCLILCDMLFPASACFLFFSSCVFCPLLTHANHLYIPSPTMAVAVPVMAVLRLPMPNMLLLFRITASWALSCECPETYVYAPRPMNAALPRSC